VLAFNPHLITLALATVLAMQVPASRPSDLLVESESDGGPSWLCPRDHPFVRVPDFRLHANGQCYFVRTVEIPRGEKTILTFELATTQLHPTVADSIRRRILALGFLQVQPYEGRVMESWTEENGTKVSKSREANTQTLRVRLDDGTIRESRNTWGRTSEQTSTLLMIRRYIAGVVDSLDAQPYFASAGVLLITQRPESSSRYDPADFEFDFPKLPATDVVEWAVPLKGEDWSLVLEAFPTNLAGRWVTYNGRKYRLTITPWLPGQDYSAEAAQHQVRAGSR
jgi:hypothetical protein